MAIDFQKELNGEQYAAVSSSARSLLILAGAGTGKTRTLTYRVAWLLEHGVGPEQILLLTFTNKAAREMLTRVEGLTGYPRDAFWGGTFHHIAQRLIRPHAALLDLQMNFGILDESDAVQLFTEAIRRTSPDFLKDKTHPKPKVLLESIDYARNARHPFEETLAARWKQAGFAVDELLGFFKNYQSDKWEQSVLDYDDLLELALRLLQEQPDIAAHYSRRFRHILVDEYQDSNDLQGQLIDLLATEHQIFAVGDDAQCIYSWRGADIENIHRFSERHPQAEIFKVTLNYRSSPEILRLANAIPITHEKVFRKELQATRAAHKKPLLVQVWDFHWQARFVLRRLRPLLDGGYRLSDIAVLYRAHYQSMELQMELSKAQVPYTVTSGVRFFEQAHIRDLIAMLRVVHNARDRCAWLRVLCRLPKVGEKIAERLLGKIDEASARSGRGFWEVLADDTTSELCPREAQISWLILRRALVGARRQLPESVTAQEPTPYAPDLFAYAATQQRIVPKAEKSDGAPQKILSLLWEGEYRDYLRRSFANASSRSEDVLALLNFAERFGTVDELLFQVALQQSEEKETAERQDCLSLTSIHQAKGLEFPVVFILCLNEGLFPSKRALEEASIQEERRLFYVAVTRAKDELYLCCPQQSSPRGPGGFSPPLQPSRFLEELSEKSYEVLHDSAFPPFPPRNFKPRGFHR
ncbi:MAG: ATP-dependent helicase [Puniceicoccales bacterium]|jgi:DNA helicase-2/ATP-dependent DNA helicase PcrA|nr:ATP-dependent helicase [Puniceicoccales bacterium]